MFNVFYVNIQSIRVKLDRLCDLIDSRAQIFDLIILTETWLSPEEEEFYNIPGYDFFHTPKLRNNTYFGGGTGIYIRESIGIVKIDVNSIGNCDVCQIFIPSANINVIALYRSHQANVDDFLNEFGHLLNSFNNNSKTLIVGDFNIDTLLSNRLVTNYKDILSVNLFVSHITDITRYKNKYDNSDGSCIDHILSQGMNINAVVERCYLSDHCFFCIEITENYNYNDISIVRRLRSDDEIDRAWRNYEDRLMNEEISFVDYVDVLKNFHSECFREDNLIIGNKPWLNNDLKSRIRYKNKLYRKSKKQPFNINLKIKYKVMLKEIKGLIQLSKKEYFEKCLKNTNNCKRLWADMNMMIGRNKKRKNNSINEIQEDNQRITDPHIIANLYAKFLGNQNGNFNMHTNVGDFNSLNNNDNNLSDSFIENNIKRAISSLKAKKNIDFQGISTFILDKYKSQTYPLMRGHFMYIFNSGIFPEWLNIVRIIPVYKKKGKMHDLANYRPISVCGAISKIIEKAMFYCLNFLIDKIGYLSDCQFAFRKGVSTTDAVMKFNLLVTNSIEKNRFCVAIFFDFKQAFDSVCHKVLIGRLNILKFPLRFVQLMESWLTGRSYFCDIKGNYSDRNKFVRGIPQGSSLGPLLFNIFINDLIIEMRNLTDIIVYADDVTVVVEADNEMELNQKIVKVLSQMSKWSKQNYIGLNYSKCCYINFSLRKLCQSIDMLIDGEVINEVFETNYLGIILDDKLNFESHIEKTIRKINARIGAIYRTRKYTSDKIRLILYQSLIHNTIIYGLPIWSQCNIYSYQKLEGKIKKCMKYINNDHNDELMQENVKFYKLDNIIMYCSLIYFYKTIHNMNGFNSNYFEKIEYSHNSRSQKNKNYRLPNFKKRFGQRTFFYRIVKIYNEIPLQIKEAETIASFKKMLRKYITDQSIWR